MKNTALAFLVLGLLTLSCHTDARAAQKTDAPAKASAVQIDSRVHARIYCQTRRFRPHMESLRSQTL